MIAVSVVAAFPTTVSALLSPLRRPALMLNVPPDVVPLLRVRTAPPLLIMLPPSMFKVEPAFSIPLAFSGCAVLLAIILASPEIFKVELLSV